MSFHVLLANVEKFSFVNSAAYTYAKVKRPGRRGKAGGKLERSRNQRSVSSTRLCLLLGNFLARRDNERRNISVQTTRRFGWCVHGARNDHVSSAIAGYLGLTGVQLRRDICAVEAAELNICSWDSMNVSAVGWSTSTGAEFVYKCRETESVVHSTAALPECL